MAIDGRDTSETPAPQEGIKVSAKIMEILAHLHDSAAPNLHVVFDGKTTQLFLNGSGDPVFKEEKNTWLASTYPDLKLDQQSTQALLETNKAKKLACAAETGDDPMGDAIYESGERARKAALGKMLGQEGVMALLDELGNLYKQHKESLCSVEVHRSGVFSFFWTRPTLAAILIAILHKLEKVKGITIETNYKGKKRPNVLILCDDRDDIIGFLLRTSEMLECSGELSVFLSSRSTKKLGLMLIDSNNSKVDDPGRLDSAFVIEI
ncbi:hypothetical protein HZA40_01375 [Candidatus Peregrinibacteria bacterium]|nr:hypothetical protein [Candidatus Peregrinibacteria bacterium]